MIQMPLGVVVKTSSLVLGAAAALFLASSLAIAADAPTWPAQFLGKELLLRPSVNESPFLYLHTTDAVWIAQLEGRCFPLMAGEAARIAGVEAEPGQVTLRLQTAHLGAATVTIRPEDSASEPATGQEAVVTLLDLLDAKSGSDVYRADPASRMLHFVGSNHAPVAAMASSFSDLDEAKTAGMHLCPICFRSIRTIQDYEEEVALGRLTSANIRSTYQLIDSGDSSERLESTGRQVLARWPIPLRGYSYRFSVIDRDDFNAVACPGGWLFVSNSLIEACESDSELEAVLAHEISHIEMRHGIRQYRSAQHAATIAGIFAGVVGAAASNGDNTALMAGAVTGVMISLALELSYAGYSRSFEDEADSYALLYVVQNHGDAARAHLASVLRKLKYNAEIVTGKRERGSAFADHPSLGARLSYVERAQVTQFPSPLAASFQDTSGGEMLAVRVNCIIFDKELVCLAAPKIDRTRAGVQDNTPEDHYLTEIRMLAEVVASNALGGAFELKNVEVRLGERWVKVDNKEDTVIGPSQAMGVSLVRKTDSRRGFEEYPSLVPSGLRVVASGRTYEWSR